MSVCWCLLVVVVCWFVLAVVVWVSLVWMLMLDCLCCFLASVCSPKLCWPSPWCGLSCGSWIERSGMDLPVFLALMPMPCWAVVVELLWLVWKSVHTDLVLAWFDIVVSVHQFFGGGGGNGVGVVSVDESCGGWDCTCCGCVDVDSVGAVGVDAGAAVDSTAWWVVGRWSAVCCFLVLGACWCYWSAFLGVFLSAAFWWLCYIL